MCIQILLRVSNYEQHNNMSYNSGSKMILTRGWDDF